MTAYQCGICGAFIRRSVHGTCANCGTEWNNEGEPVMNSTDRSAPTWENQLWHARQLPTSELRRHASVSRENRHRCRDCFCCAALTVIEERARGEGRAPVNGAADCAD